MWFNCFDKIFVINLPSRADRRQEIDQQLRRLGLSLQHERVVLFPAVRPSDAGGFPSIGARGCFMSHLGVLREASRQGLGNILILEDDCDFIRDAEKKSLELVSLLKNDQWALFYGGALNSFDSETHCDPLRVVRPTSSLMGSHCIAVKDKIIPLLINYFEAMLQRLPGSADGGPMHVDGAYSWFRAAHPNLVTLIAHPQLAFQRSSATDVHQRPWFDHVWFISRIVYRLRKIRNLNR